MSKIICDSLRGGGGLAARDVALGAGTDGARAHTGAAPRPPGGQRCPANLSLSMQMARATRRPLWCAPGPSACPGVIVSPSPPKSDNTLDDGAPTHDAPAPVPFPLPPRRDQLDATPADAFDKTHAPPVDDPGDTLCGVRLGFDGVFAALSALTIVLISASCYFEEWMYKALPGFDYFWTVAFAELLVFSVMSIAGAFATGTLGALLRDRKAPLYKYVLQAAVMAVYAAVAKIAYKYLNYATATVLRSSKLVFVMAISVTWLGRKYSASEYASAVAMIAAVACFGLGEAGADDGGENRVVGYVLSVLGLGLAALQTNMADNAMRDHGASTLENMLYVNALGLVVVAAAAAAVDGREAVEYMARTEHALTLLVLRSLTFYFGALTFTELTRHSGATPATSVATARKGITVVGSFVMFPGDKPMSWWFGGGIILFLAAIGMELKSRLDRAKRR